MNIKEAKIEIKHTVQAYLSKDEFGQYKISRQNQRPLLLMGPPGIGKTQIMEQVARECKIGLVAYTITHHTRQSAIGLPFIQEKEYQGKKMNITEYTTSEIIASIYESMEKTGLNEGILFIDEINCVSETLAPTMLQFLQNKMFGNQSIPEGWVIVAAGNPPEYNKSVREFDMVTLDRVRYMNVEADYKIWKEYALSKHLHPMILSYLELKPNRFYKVQTSIDGMEFVTARGWEDLSHLIDLYDSMHIDVTQEVIEEYIHDEDIAEDVAAYSLLYKKYEDDYGILSILNGDVSTTIYQRLWKADFDERISVVSLLLDGIHKKLQIYFDLQQLVDGWYAFLKKYRKEIETISYDEQIKKYEEKWNQNKKTGLYNASDITISRRLLSCLKQVIIDPDLSNQEAFSLAREPFEKARMQMEKAEDIALCSLNHAFTFMENAFEQGQEMVVFVTNLSLSNLSSLFLSEHNVVAYDTYKEKLLIGTRKQEILEQLNH